ncbi:MAG TPA: endonuclease III [Desulfotignum sp.]|nr:endonuclease III [Desulfotignum sp.]
MNKSNICFLLRTLKERYPDVKTQLDHQTPFQLLTATILSAQCTDRQVNQVTQRLFAQFPDPAALAGADLSDIKKIVFSTGFYNNKAKNIKACARALLERHHGLVPDDLDLLVKLPGVGRKTANVVRSAAFGHPAIVVDTHVLRISGRLGLTTHTDPVKVEFDLMRRIPESAWSDLSLQFIYFGREICDARKPLCQNCPLQDICVFPGKASRSLGSAGSSGR